MKTHIDCIAVPLPLVLAVDVALLLHCERVVRVSRRVEKGGGNVHVGVVLLPLTGGAAGNGVGSGGSGCVKGMHLGRAAGDHQLCVYGDVVS